MCKHLPPKILVSTLLYLICRDGIPQDIKTTKKNYLISMFGSLEGATRYTIKKCDM